MLRLLYILLSFTVLSNLSSQTIQFQFCGKTEAVSPVIDPITGQDQRGNAAIKLDFLKIGIRGTSQTTPFYVLGNVETGPKVNDNFKNKVLVDNCTGGVMNGCSSCGICAPVESTNSGNLGSITGNFLMPVKAETNNNNLYIMCTNQNYVVCYESHKISLAGYSNKKIDVYWKIEGIAKNNISQVRNISLNYRFNNDAYFTTPYFVNKNSNNVGEFEDVGAIFASVPVATVDLSKKLKFDISPNPVTSELKVNLTVFKNFDGFINILNEKGSVAYSERATFDSNETNKTIDVGQFPSGIYILNISDEDGRASVLKFQKL